MDHLKHLENAENYATPISEQQYGGYSYLENPNVGFASPTGALSLSQSHQQSCPKIKENSEDFVNGQIKVSQI